MALYAENLVSVGNRDPIEEEKSPTALVADFDQERKKAQFGLSIQQTSGVNPDEHAEAIEISEKIGLPADSVRMDLPAKREQVKREDINYSGLLKETPKLAQSLSSPDFSKIVMDDLEPLKKIESSLMRRGLVDPLIAIGGKAPVGFAESLVGITDIALGRWLSYAPDVKKAVDVKGGLGGILKETVGLDFAETQRTMQEWLSPETQEGAKRVEEAEGFINTIGAYIENPSALTQEGLASWTYLVSSAGAAKSLMASGASGAQALFGAHVVEGLLTSGSIEQSLINEGVDPQRAREYSSMAGTMTTLIGWGAGKLGMGDAVEGVFLPKKPAKIFETATKGSIRERIKDLTSEAAKGFVQEGVVEEGLQNVSETIFQNLAKDLDPLEGIGKAYAQGLTIGGTIGAGMNVTSRMVSDHAAIKQAEQNQEIMEALGDSVKASELTKRSPKKLKEFIESVTKDGDIENIYIPIEKFDEYFQSEDVEFDQLLNEIPAIGEQIAQARERGGDLIIPISEYASIIAPTQHHEGLINDIKFNSTDLTPREAAEMQESMGEVMAEYVKTEQERVDKDAETQSAFDNINESLYEHLKESGMSTTESKTQAALIANAFSTLEERYGVDAVKEFEKRGIEVRYPKPESVKKADDVDVLIDRARLARQPKQAELYGKSLMQSLADKGGVQDEGGELSTKDAQLWHRKHYNRKFVKEEGMDFDTALETAIQEGYLQEGADINDFLTAVDKEIFGDPTYIEGAADQVAIDKLEEDQALIDYLDQKGISLATATNEEVKAALQGVEVAEDGVTYEQLEQYTVKVEAIEEETGREVSLQESANIALKEVDNSISVLQELITCVR